MALQVALKSLHDCSHHQQQVQLSIFVLNVDTNNTQTMKPAPNDDWNQASRKQSCHKTVDKSNISGTSNPICNHFHQSDFPAEGATLRRIKASASLRADKASVFRSPPRCYTRVKKRVWRFWADGDRSCGVSETFFTPAPVGIRKMTQFVLWHWLSQGTAGKEGVVPSRVTLLLALALS